MLNMLEDLYVTTREDTGKSYWHVELERDEDGAMHLLVRKSGKRIPIDGFGLLF
jgi:hypothetical protein